MTADGYNTRSKRFQTPIRGGTFNIATDFAAKERFWWIENGVNVPGAKLFLEKRSDFRCTADSSVRGLGDRRQGGGRGERR